MKPFVYTTLIAHFLLQTVYAADNNVAKVIIIKGQVKAKIGEQVVDVQKDQWLPEGAALQTADKSFVKLLFIDKSQMNLGPNSQMNITSFPKNDAGIISLVKGELRSKVTKDYMDMDSKDKSKLFIKTKSAAMGIRGTEFQVNFNPDNNNTALIMFEGKIAFTQIEERDREQPVNQKSLEQAVSSEKAVMVKEGQMSAVVPGQLEKPTIPTLLSKEQLDTLKKSDPETEKKSDDQASAPKKEFKSPIPPGVDSKQFTNTSSEAEKEVAKAIGSDGEKKLEEVKKEVMKEKEVAKSGNAEGFFNPKTGELAPPAGSMIDLKTVNIIPVPKNAVFDENSGTFKMPPNVGRVDDNGNFRPPEGVQITTDGKFVTTAPMPKDGDKGGRMPASIAPTGPAAMPGKDFAPMGLADFKKQQMEIAMPELASGKMPMPGMMPPPNLEQLAQDTVSDAQTKQETILQNQQMNENARVKFVFGSTND